MAAKTKAKRAEHVEVTESFSGAIDGVPFTANRGSIYAGDEKIVEEYPDFFRPVSRNRPEVEQATAAPGEKRGE
jgi:hypothetical protein